MKSWKLKRTVQCKACPWRQSTDPYAIPNGYSVEQHRALATTIATPGDLGGLGRREVHVMACHESHEEYCVGWLHHQLGVGNNLWLRLLMLSCTNAGDLRVSGPQHARFEDTLPEGSP